MYLHFEDWTDPTSLQNIEDKGMIHNKRIIKVMASEVDPRVALGRSALTIIESSGEVFALDEIYSYSKRRTYTGVDLEDKLAGYELGQVAQRSIRSLFRFSNAEGFCQATMAATKANQQWLVRHPFEEIDGIAASKGSPILERFINLDIRTPNCLEDLRRIVDYDNEATMLGKLEWLGWVRKDLALQDPVS